MFKLVSHSRIAMEGHAGPDAFATHVPDGPDDPVLGGPGHVSDALPRASYNSNAVLSSVAPATAYPYFSRPLPRTPPPRAKMPGRPSTAEGPGSKNSVKPGFIFDKRVSRDDSSLSLRAGAGAGYRTYTPARGQLPTPDDSPRASPAPRTGGGPTYRMPTPESLVEAPIGMALGSPTHQPAELVPSQQDPYRLVQTPTPSIFSPGSGISHLDAHDTPVPRKQSSGKWKLFSRFTRKTSDPPNPYLANPKPNDPKGKSKAVQASVASFQPPSEIKLDRSHTVSAQKSARHKPTVSRSQTMPYLESSVQESKSRLDLNDKRVDDAFGKIPIALDQPAPKSCGPLLDVQIPTIKMERYSVMFGSVLQSQTPQRQPSLLARRQATMQKLKSIDDAVEKEQVVKKKHHETPRTTTSPQSMMSPAFALFPPTPAHRQDPLLPPKHGSPRSRSNTSPSIQSPRSLGNFEDVSPLRRHPSENIHNRNRKPSVGKGKLTIATLAKSREQQAAIRQPQFSPDQSSLILESPTDSDFPDSPEVEIVRTGSIRPGQPYTQEPKWQMVTPSGQPTPTLSSSTASSSAATASTSSGSIGGQKHRSLSPTSSTNTHVTSPPPSQEIDEILQETGGNRNPVEISIARQISISRQQRHMLRPLQTNFSTPRPTTPNRGASPSSSSAVKVSPVRFAATKTATPTLVVPAVPPEVSLTPRELAQHRKSERVVLERA
ncbi:hypothetical protein F5B20DRAFT_420111 [Whalleya microplaca]|nr:hypothetical protein F5B20DRAFT_420111 [Whalleya microplaca]